MTHLHTRKHTHARRFADIKGFTSLVNQLHPSQVMLFLNSLYSVWDSLLEPFGVYKVETIGGERRHAVHTAATAQESLCLAWARAHARSHV